MKIAILMMHKNDNLLLPSWLAYHEKLVGKDNIYIWDNGSEGDEYLGYLHRLRDSGYNIFFDAWTPLHYRKKGDILGNKIKELDQVGEYDFFIPLDCDEFFCLESEDKLLFDQEAIFNELNGFINSSAALSIESAYYNILGHPNYYWRMDGSANQQTKTFFPKKSFTWMDRGYHVGRTKSQERIDTKFTMMHFHYRPYSVIAQHSKNKLRPFMDVDNEQVLAENKSNRLVSQILASEEEYMKRFRIDDGLFARRGKHVPEFAEYLDKNNIALPF